jgi:hypothetical protein
MRQSKINQIIKIAGKQKRKGLGVISPLVDGSNPSPSAIDLRLELNSAF